MKMLFAAMAVLTCAQVTFADVQTWRTTGRADDEWNTSSANWDNGVQWVNGNVAIIPAGGSPALVTEPISLAGMTNAYNWATGSEGIYASGDGKLVFTGDAPEVYVGSTSLHFYCPVESAEPLTVTGFGALFLFASNSFPKGVIKKNGQIRFGEGGLGVGPLSIGAGTSFWTSQDNLDVTNKIIQTGLGYGGTLNATTAIFRRFGTTDANVGHLFGLGRTNGGKSSAILSLSDESEGIGQYRMRGDFSLTVNGGTIKAREDSQSPFFQTWEDESYWDRTISVGNDGFVFDSNGATEELELGATLVFPAKTSETGTNSIEVMAFENPSLENDDEHWTFGKLTGNKYAPIGRTENGGTYCSQKYPEHYTTNGNYFIALRCYSYAKSDFNVPDDGLWRIVCDIGYRATYDGWSIPVTVTIDEGLEGEQSYVIPSREKDQPFKRCETCEFQLTAGTHTVKFAAGDITVSGDDKSIVYLDTFRIARDSVWTNEFGTLVKKGIGTLAIENLSTDGRVVVSNGTLKLRDADLDGAKLDVQNGAALALSMGSLSNVLMSVSAGATLRFLTESTNFIANGRFEAPVVTKAQATLDQAGWGQVSDSEGKASGMQVNGCTASAKSARTPDGNQTAFVRGQGGAIYTSFSVPSDGVYTLSFLQAPRYDMPGRFELSVLIDDEEVFSLDHEQSWHYDFERQTMDVRLTAGTDHVLKFLVSGGVQTGEMMFIDDVRLNAKNAGATKVLAGRIDLASGSTVDLQNTTRLEIPAGIVFVDGVMIVGGRAELRQHGVEVTGMGSIRIGGPKGLVLVVR